MGLRVPIIVFIQILSSTISCCIILLVSSMYIHIYVYVKCIYTLYRLTPTYIHTYIEIRRLTNIHGFAYMLSTIMSFTPKHVILACPCNV